MLFNPNERPDPLSVALGFAVLLLPYSLAGPFVGVSSTGGAGGTSSSWRTWCGRR